MAADRSTKMIRSLLLLNFLVWIILAVLTFFRSAGEILVENWTTLLISAMMIGNALALGLCAWQYQHKFIRVFALTWLLINVILTFTDQFGLLDALTLILDLLIISLILQDLYQEPHP